MAKRSRGRVTHEPAAATASQRVTRARPRRATRRSANEPLFDRYRSLIIGGIALAGLLLIGYLFLQGATSSAYACRSLLTPGPSEPVPTPRPATPTPSLSPSPTAGSPSPTTGSPSPAAGGSPSPTAGESPSPTSGGSPSPTTGESPSPTAGESPSPGSPSPSASPSGSPSPQPSPTARLGFTTADMGAFHVVDPGQTITYDYCPPASGEHYNLANRAPMPPAVYPPAEERAPGFWVHNLEHGYSVVLYRCPSGQLGVGDCISQAEFDQLGAYFDQAPAPDVSTCPTKVMVARFDEMSTDFAVLAWDRALLLEEFDLDKAHTFAEQWMEHAGVPEVNAC